MKQTEEVDNVYLLSNIKHFTRLNFGLWYISIFKSRSYDNHNNYTSTKLSEILYKDSTVKTSKDEKCEVLGM